MNELKVIDFHGKEVIDSREVAVMVLNGYKKMVRGVLRAWGIPVPKALTKQVSGQTCLFDPPASTSQPDVA